MLGKIKVRRKRQFAEQRELGRSIAVWITNLNVEIRVKVMGGPK